MWLLPSQLRSSASAPGSEASSSGCGSPECAHVFWPALSGTPSPRPCSWRGWRTRPWSRVLFGAATWRTSMPDHLREWISSVLGIRASVSPLPGSDLGNEIPDGSGPKLPVSSLSPGLATSFSKTSATIFESPSTMFGMTWEQWATDVRRDYSRRLRLALHISGNGSSSWPTPNTQDSENNGGPSQLSRRTPPLNAAAMMWPTPRSSANENRTTKNAPSHGTTHEKTLAGEASESSLLALGTEASGHEHSSECLRLNPQFVGWLMGLPPGWTDPDSPIASTGFAAWETVSSRSLRHLLSAYSQSGLA